MVGHQWHLINRCFVSNLVGVCTDMTDVFLGGNVSAPEFQTIGVLIDDAVLVHKKLLLCVIYCWLLMLQLQSIL